MEKLTTQTILGFLSNATEQVGSIHQEGSVDSTSLPPLFSQEPLRQDNPFAYLIREAKTLGLNPASVCRIIMDRLGIKDHREF